MAAFGQIDKRGIQTFGKRFRHRKRHIGILFRTDHEYWALRLRNFDTLHRFMHDGTRLVTPMLKCVKTSHFIAIKQCSPRAGQTRFRLPWYDGRISSSCRYLLVPGHGWHRVYQYHCIGCFRIHQCQQSTKTGAENDFRRIHFQQMPFYLQPVIFERRFRQACRRGK